MDLTLSGRYELGERIGTGGSAQVYSARDLLLDRLVAVKILDEEAARTADPAARERFVSEARTSARFSHPHAVATLDAGVDQGKLFLVMELVSGRSLAERLAQDGPLSEEQATRLGAEILGALGAAHRVGLVHRDVKPANVLLDGDGAAKLADFGIAKRFDEIGDSLTQTGMVVGTRHYLSPEQAAGRPLGPTSDLFSLGVVLYEAVTGARPSPGIERASDHRLDVRAVRPALGAGLAAVIARATAVGASERYETANAMAEELKSAVASDVGTGGATAAMPAFLQPTAAMTQPAAQMPPPAPAATPIARRSARPASSRSSDARAWFIAVLALLAIGGAGLGIALAQSSGDDATGAAGQPEPSAAPSAAPPPTNEAATTSAAPAASTTSASTSTSTTTSTTTTTPTTSTVVTTTTPAPEELIPGFPVPDSVEQFVETLNDDPDLAGPRGEKLAEEFAKLLDRDGNNRANRRDKLQSDIEKWVDDGELDTTIAEAAVIYLNQLDVSGGDGDGDGDGGNDDDDD